MPNTMAPTKANATYATTTLTLLTNGPVKVIGNAPWFTSAARTDKDNDPVVAEKSASLSLRHFATVRSVVKE